MAGSGVHNDDSPGGYEVAVTIMPIAGVNIGASKSPARSSGGLPGHDDAIGRPWGQRRGELLERGEQAVGAATDALARQIATTARRIGKVIEEEQVVSSRPETFGLESVQVSFGVTLSTGIQALFTAQAESSAQVTITLSQRPDGGSGHTT